MKQTKKMLTAALALLLALCCLFTGCAKDPADGENTTVTTGGGDPALTPGKVGYTVSVKTAGGMAMSGLTVYLYADEALQELRGYGTTDANGIAVVSLTAGTYYVTLVGVPAGYNTQASYPIQGTSANIVLSSSVVPGSSLTGTYGLGSVMNDFTVTTYDDKTYTLSEILKTKEMVLLNFWYDGCTYCLEEFPAMEIAYQANKEKAEILALSPYDDSDGIADFLENYADYFPEDGLNFPMAFDAPGVIPHFNVSGFPTTVVIDRYGVICLMVSGAIAENQFNAIYDHFTGDDYKQMIIEDPSILTPAEKPNVAMPTSDEMAAVFNKGEISVSFTPELGESDKEYAWPFVIGEKDGVACIQPSNAKKTSSFAMLYAYVELKAGEALAFDYFASSEQGNDVMYVLVDRRDIYQISGVSSQWNTCVPYVAQKDGTYELALCYLKDSGDDVGDDTVYLKDLRVMDAEDVPVATYIPRYCATDFKEDMSGYETYVTPVFNENDGYWHVGSENGPLLLANLLITSPFSQGTTVYSMAYNGDITLNGVNYYEQMLPYFTMASNATITGVCTVNEELGNLLKIVAEAVGQEKNNPNQWLQMCSYYDAYGPDVEAFADPVKGLSAHSAFEATVGSENSVTYTHPVLPRGYLYKFVPTQSGAYRITSHSDQLVEAWIFAEDTKTILMTYEAMERDKLSDELYYYNCTMVAYLEAGKTYYIDIAYWDVYGVGTFTFDLEYKGTDYSIFRLVSPGPFTFVESDDLTTGEILVVGANVVLGEDGYYHVVRADGSIGSIVYAEIEMTTSVFTENSIYSMVYDKNGNLIEDGAFNFAYSEMDHLYKRFYDAETNTFDQKGFDALLGEGSYDLFKEEIIDFTLGILHGEGPDLTAEMAAYIDAMYDSYDQTPEERQGCIAVDERLAEILQMLMDKYTFNDVKDSWRRLSYYYQTFDEVESLLYTPEAE